MVEEEKLFIEDSLEHCMMISAAREDIDIVVGYT